VLVFFLYLNVKCNVVAITLNKVYDYDDYDDDYDCDEFCIVHITSFYPL